MATVGLRGSFFFIGYPLRSRSESCTNQTQFLAAFGIHYNHNALFVRLAYIHKTFLVYRVVGAPELSSLLLTFGISIFVPNLAMLAWSSDFRSVEFLTGSYLIGPLALSKPRLITFSVALAVTGLAFLFLNRTKLGKAIRATSQQREVAQVCGVNVRRIDLITFGLAAGLAGVGGSLVSVMFSISPEMGQIYVFKSFLVIVLGGAGNYPGAFAGGLLLGVIESLASLYISARLSEVIAYVLLVIVLLVRPTGLFGWRV